MGFEWVLKSLSAAEVDYLVVGGVAVVLLGHRRMTADLDLVVNLDASNLVRCLTCLESLGFRPRAPVRSLDFAVPELRREWVESKGMKVFSMWHPDNAVPTVDLFAEVPFDYEDVRSRAIRLSLDDETVTVIGRSDLIVMKEAVGRPQDLADVLVLRSFDESEG